MPVRLDIGVLGEDCTLYGYGGAKTGQTGEAILWLAVDDVGGDRFVKASGTFIDSGAGGRISNEFSNLFHLGDPAIGLGKHWRDKSIYAVEKLRLSASELDPQGLGETVARGRGNDRSGEGYEGKSSSLTT